MHSNRLRLLSGIIFFTTMFLRSAAAGDWEPDTPPQLQGILSGGQLIPNATTLIIIEGGSVTLSASAIDFDKLVYGGEQPDEFSQDGGAVEWSASNNGKIDGGDSQRKNSGATVTITGPAIPLGQSEISFTVTAKPDDDSQQNPGDPLGLNFGNRNDDPGAGQTVTIKVIKNCPTTVTIAQTCSGPPDWDAFWAANANIKALGLLTARMAVSGGTPPNPPGNWNGLVIKEVVAGPNPALSAAEVAKFEIVNPFTNCAGSAEFVVGTANNFGSVGNCTLAATDNSFWDLHFASANGTSIKAGETQAVTCTQTYKCKDTVLGGTFSITRTHTDTTWSNQRRTRILTTKD